METWKKRLGCLEEADPFPTGWGGRPVFLALAATLLAAGPSPAEDGVRFRYDDPSGRMSLTVTHDIEVREGTPVASRQFSFDLDLAAQPAAVEITIERAKAIYQAHGMEERLGTRHLAGRSFSLSIRDGGRRLEPADPPDAPLVELGPAVAGGVSVAGVLVDFLPELPREGVGVGTTWTTERPVRSLEGWAWATGRMTSLHRVAAIERKEGHTIVSVETEAEAGLGPVEGGRAYSGDLKRTLHWNFDATDGRLLSMVMTQETEGSSVMPQGELPIHQTTRIELAPLS